MHTLGKWKTRAFLNETLVGKKLYANGCVPQFTNANPRTPRLQCCLLASGVFVNCGTRAKNATLKFGVRGDSVGEENKFRLPS